jgi:hypothetical protein
MASSHNNISPTSLHTTITNTTSDYPSSAYPRTDGSDAQLTDGQVDFVNDLYRRNIPASVIARITERMLHNSDSGSEGLYTGVGSDDGVAPPSYDLHNR